MAKRFTDTDKWKRPWFRELAPTAKIVWFYILDNCDHCGVWAGDFALLNFQTGLSISPQAFAQWFGDKFVTLDEKYFFPSFVEFQQGKLSPAKNAHRPIIEFLDKNGLSLDLPNQNVMGSEPIGMGPSKVKVTVKVNSIEEGGVGETNQPASKPLPGEDLKKDPVRLGAELAEACEEWKSTLRHFGMGRSLLADEEERIARAVQKYGLNAVKLALLGATVEPRGKDWKPDAYVQIVRYLAYDKFQRFLNLGTAEFHKRKGGAA